MRSARLPSRVHTPATRPKAVPLAMRQRLGLAVEGDHHLHRAEDLFLRQRGASAGTSATSVGRT